MKSASLGDVAHIIAQLLIERPLLFSYTKKLLPSITAQQLCWTFGRSYQPCGVLRASSHDGISVRVYSI